MLGLVLLILCALAFTQAKPTPSYSTVSVPGATLGVRKNDCLWPPNHKYVYFFDVAKSDNYVKPLTGGCAFPVEKKVTGCISDQPDNGLGDGTTVRDCVYVPKNDAVCVRSERQGMVPAGRTYHVIFELTSKCFGKDPISVKWPIHVPHDAADLDTKSCWNPNHQTKSISCDPDLLPATPEPLCQPGKCNDGNDCTSDFCIESTGLCSHTSLGCDDGDACTNDLCDVTGGVSSASVKQMTSNPGCATIGLGSEGKYEPVRSGLGQLLHLSEETAVTIDISTDKQTASFEVTGGSVTAVIVKAGTDSLVYHYGGPADADQAIHGPARARGGFYEISHITFCWGTATAKVGGCKHEPVNCDDNDVCTLDSCEGSTGCTHTSIAAPRVAGKCEVASCDPVKGWQFVPNNLNCDDGDACTVDTCDNELGCVHTPVARPATNPCQVAKCDPKQGWIISDKVCTSDDPCQTASCVEGVCKNTPKTCDDGLFCTVDTCVPNVGCKTALALPPSVPSSSCFSLACDETSDAWVEVPTGTCAAPAPCSYSATPECFSTRTQTLQGRANAWIDVLKKVLGTKYVEGSLYWGNVHVTFTDYGDLYYWYITSELTATEKATLEAEAKAFWFLNSDPRVSVATTAEGKLNARLELFPDTGFGKRAFVEEAAFPVVEVAVGAFALVAVVVVAAFFFKKN